MKAHIVELLNFYDINNQDYIIFLEDDYKYYGALLRRKDDSLNLPDPEGYPQKIEDNNNIYYLHDPVVEENSRSTWYLDDNIGKYIINNSDKYLIARELGKGAKGTVYMGYNDEGDKVLIKKYKRKNINRAEYDIGKYLDCSQGLLCPIDFFSHNNIDYMISKYIENSEDLETFLDNNYDNLDIETKIDIAKNIAEILQDIHDKNIVHRDIKPENILIQTEYTINREDEEDLIDVVDAVDPADTVDVTQIIEPYYIPYIIDYDISCSLDKLNKYPCLSKTIGSPFTIAPEVWKNNIDDFKKSDIYSLGTVLYKIFNNKYPYEAENQDILRRKVLKETTPKSKSGNNMLDSLIEDMIDKNYKNRPDIRNVVDKLNTNI